MLSDDVAVCRQQLESHLRNLVDTKTAISDAPVTDVECADLIEELQKLSSRNPEAPWTISPSPPDVALRELLFDLLSEISISDPQFIEVWYLLDLATILSNNNLAEPASDFLLIESLLDSQTVSGCRKIFDYLESRRDKLLAHYFDKKNLVILRCCNELLRRLSRAEDTVFCGRILIFLFQSFPLGDKSSVNLRGEFHTENVTHFDPIPKRSEDAIKPTDIDLDTTRPASSGVQTPTSLIADADVSQKTGRSTPIPTKPKSETKGQAGPPDLDALFPQFWSLQGLFSRPTRLFEPAAMSQFKEGLAATLGCFKSLSTTTAASTAPADRGIKRKRNEADGARTSQPYNPKYLTNRDLFDLEVQDVAFRRHILTQCLIMLDFSLSLSATAKAKLQGATNKSVVFDYTLSEDDVRYCHATRQSIATYLQQQGPGLDGKHYYRMVDAVLNRDKNWARWKADSCAKELLVREAVEFDAIISARKTLCDLTAKRPFANPPGANDFSFLSISEPLEALKHPSKRQKVPTLEDYYNEIESAKLDEDFATEEEKKEIQERIQGSLWRALRVSASEGRRFELCEKIKDGANTKALINIEEPPPEITAEEDQKASGEQQETPATNGDTQDSTEAANNAKNTTPIPQTDGTNDEPETTEETGAEASPSPQAEVDTGITGETEEDEDVEVAPSGEMDVDDPPQASEPPPDTDTVDAPEAPPPDASEDDAQVSSDAAG